MTTLLTPDENNNEDFDLDEELDELDQMMNEYNNMYNDDDRDLYREEEDGIL